MDHMTLSSNGTAVGFPANGTIAFSSPPPRLLLLRSVTAELAQL